MYIYDSDAVRHMLSGKADEKPSVIFPQISTAQYPEHLSWDDNIERDNQTQMDSQTTLYETEAEPQKQHFLDQLVEFYCEFTSGTLSLTDVQSCTSY